MTGFCNTDVSHMYGNKHFALRSAEVTATQDGAITLELQSKFKREKSPVHLTLAPADAVRLGEALIKGGRSVEQQAVQ